MRRYETITILKPSLGEDDLKSIIDRSTGIIEGLEGTIIKLDRWGLKKLAYPIGKEQQGHYLYMQYAGVPAAVSELERIYRIDDRIMKFLTVKLQEVFSELPEDVATETVTPEAADQEPIEAIEEA